MPQNPKLTVDLSIDGSPYVKAVEAMTETTPDALPALRPECPSSAEHGFMALLKPGTPEQAWCGTWYRCCQCTSSVLLQSPELAAFLAAEATAQRSLFEIADGER